MGAWHGTYANLLRSRFSALVAYAEALVDDRGEARDLAQAASVEVFSRRRAPRDSQSAEIAAREWMATKALDDGVDVTHVATVLIAIDGHDAAGVRAVLKKATPDPLPEVDPRDVAALRQRFAETAAVYSTPSGGVNTVMEPARQRHRSALIGAAAGTLAAVAAVAVAGWFGLNHLPDFTSSADGPTTSASPKPSQAALSVTWNPEPVYDDAMAGFHYPQCGDTWDPQPQAVGGVTPEPIVGTLENDSKFGQSVSLSDSFVSDDGKTTPLLAAPYNYVVTKDGEVVYTSHDDFSGLGLFNANAPHNNNGGMGLSPAALCDAQGASDKLFESMEGLSAEDQDKLWEKFYKKWGKFEPGTYKIYQVSPMVFGEQAALGQAFALDGITDTTSLSYDIAWTPLAEDPRIAPYCVGSMDIGDYACNPPASVLKEVLTRGVDPAWVNDVAPGVGISEPLEVTVD